MSTLTGTGTLIRLILRRDRIRLTLWIAALAGTTVTIARGVADVFPTQQVLQTRAELMENPMMIAFNGPGHGLDNYTLGALIANEHLVLVAIAAALMSVFMVVRYTRAEEETGRTELVRASVIGRHAATAAAILVVGAANVIIGGLIALGLAGTVDELPVRGSFMFGMSAAAVGIVFTGVAALAAQLTEHARSATGIGGIALGVAFVLRAVGDVGGGALSWLSPIGWSQATRSFVDERWWPLLISTAVMAVLIAGAFAISARRDVSAGLLRPRPGPAIASSRLLRPVGLALRLQRGALVGWGVGLLMFGVAFGAVVGEVEAFIDQNSQLAEFFTAREGMTVLDSFLGFLVLLLALLATGYAVQSQLRARSEEGEGRAEALLATALPRARWAGSHLAVASLGGAGVLLAGSLGLGIAAAVDQSDPGLLAGVVGAGLAYIPALFVCVGLVALLNGFVPRAAGLGWALPTYALLVGVLGDLLELPDWAGNLSPFGHVPELPGGELVVAPVLALAAIGGAMAALGLRGFRRRDVNVT